MGSSVFLVVGILFGFLCAIVATLLILVIPKLNSPNKEPTVEEFKNRIGSVRTELRTLEQQIWEYGIGKEEENKTWRRSYQDFVGKIIPVLHSCWLGREDDHTAKAVYNEMMNGLKTIGIEEIIPKYNEAIDINDRKYSVRLSDGDPPYIVNKVIYPGYQLRSRKLDSFYLSQPFPNCSY